MFDDLAYLTFLRITAASNGISQYNNMDRVRDTSKYHPKHSVSMFKVKVIQDHKVMERSNWKFYVWVGLGCRSAFRQERDNDPITFLNYPNRQNFESWENAERYSVSHKYLFLTNTEKSWRYSDVITTDVSKLASPCFTRLCQIDGCEGTENSAFARMCQIDGWEGRYWKFGVDLLVSSGDIVKKREWERGQKLAPVSVVV